jgi:hypothetical protein
MNKLYGTGAVVPGTTGASSFFQVVLVALPLLGCMQRVQPVQSSVALPLTLDARWSADPERAQHGFSQLHR